jgi:hypothetical protein
MEGLLSVVADSLHPGAVAPQKQLALQRTHQECQIKQKPRTQATRDIEKLCTLCGHLQRHHPTAHTEPIQFLLTKTLQLETGKTGRLFEMTLEQIPLKPRGRASIPIANQIPGPKSQGAKYQISSRCCWPLKGAYIVFLSTFGGKTKRLSHETIQQAISLFH